MGVFRQPPIPHIGGRQPLEQRKLPPSITAVPVDNPPFGVPNHIWRILASWEPEEAHRQSLAKIIAGVPVDNPPFGVPNPIWGILASWEPGVVKRQAAINAIIVSVAPAAITRRGTDLWYRSSS